MAAAPVPIDSNDFAAILIIRQALKRKPAKCHRKASLPYILSRHKYGAFHSLVHELVEQETNMPESEGGLLSRVFIGRHAEREQIKTRLHQRGGFVLLFGQPLVGKSSLALQVAEELQGELENDEDSSVGIYSVDCSDAVDWPDVMRSMCRALSLEETAANENLLVGAIQQLLQKSGHQKILLLLLRVHGLNPSGKDLQSMSRCLQALSVSNVLTLITSRRQLHLPSVQRINPLTSNDALQLLRHYAPDISAEEFSYLVERYCYGLPPLVVQMAQLVSGGSLMAYSAAELQQVLEEDNGLLMEGLSEEARSLFSTLSPEVRSHVSNLVQLLDSGSFSLEELQAVVGLEGARVKTVLRRLHDESPLIIDNESRRMRIEPLVLHHIRKLGHVATDDQARFRVVTLLGRVLTRAERDLYVAGQDTVYGHLHGDWPKLQHVLRQAIHCTGNTYRAYLQVALQADKLLAKCFPNEALMFYKNMAAAAVRFGTSRDQAILQGLIGMAVTQGQGMEWQEALHYFHRAMPVLQQEPHSVNYLRLLCDMGVTNFRLNRLQESETCLQKAVSISREVFVEDERELIFHLLRARSLLVLPVMFRGHLTESKALLLETLELCEQFAPHHPDKPVLINSLGLVYERSGEDQDKALHYYKRSLAERRRYADVAPGDLVPTLNNVGMQYSRRGDYDTALKLLEEAAAIRARDNRWHYYTALTEQHMGQVSIQMGDYRRAERHLQEAACIYSRCTPGHDVRGKVALTLAHLYITDQLRDVAQAKRYLNEVQQLAHHVDKDLSDGGLQVLMNAIEHWVQLQGWLAKSSILDWARQLLNNFEGDPSAQLEEHKSIVADLMDLKTPEIPEDVKDVLRSRIITQCQMCKYLSACGNASSMWRLTEDKSRSFQEAIQFLTDSRSIRKVLELTQQHSSHGTNGPAAFRRQETRGIPASIPETSPNRHQFGVEQESVNCAVGLSDQAQHYLQEPSRGTIQGDLTLLEPGWRLVQETMGQQNQGREGQSFREHERLPASSPSALSAQSFQHWSRNESNMVRTFGHTPGQLSGIERDQETFSSFTSSNPPSMSISDESVGSSAEEPQEGPTFYTRAFCHQQETARDQISIGFCLNPLERHLSDTDRSMNREERNAGTRASPFVITTSSDALGTELEMSPWDIVVQDQHQAIRKFSETNTKTLVSEAYPRGLPTSTALGNQAFQPPFLQTPSAAISHLNAVVTEDQAAALRKLGEQSTESQERTSMRPRESELEFRNGEICRPGPPLQCSHLDVEQFVKHPESNSETFKRSVGTRNVTRATTCSVGSAGETVAETADLGHRLESGLSVAVPISDQGVNNSQDGSSILHHADSLPAQVSSTEACFHACLSQNRQQQGAVEEEKSPMLYGTSAGCSDQVCRNRIAGPEATENDERQNDHVCYSVNCCCSLRPDL